MTSYYLPSESKIGAGFVAHRLAQVLSARGHHVTMFSPCRRPDDALYEHAHVPIAGSLRTFKWGALVRGLDLDGFDVLHAHGDDHLRSRRSTPVHVRTLHGSCFSEALHIRGVKERTRMVALGCTEIAGSVRADAAVGVSKSTVRWYPWVKRVIPNGVDLDLFRPGDKEPTPTILFVGTYHRRKRGYLLMDAFEKHVMPAMPDARLWMVCSDAPAAPNVEILGRVTDGELASLYRRAWVFCLPSTYEGFGVPYIEAMASGTPVVATSNPGSDEVLDGGRFGNIVQSERLGSALLELLRSPDRRRLMAERGRQRANEFGWENVAAAYERLYAELLERRRVKPARTIRRR
jgi:glycosyltransferase involved in cell wall biosynthesis